MPTKYEIADDIDALACKPGHSFNDFVFFAAEQATGVKVVCFRKPTEAEEKALREIAGEIPLDITTVEIIEKAVLDKLDLPDPD